MHALLVPVVFAAVCLYVLYWTVRCAVRHALADADERRSKEREGGRSIEP